jgi:hypothetical protein
MATPPQTGAYTADLPAVPAWLNKGDNASAATTLVGIQSAAGGFPRRARVVPHHGALWRSRCAQSVESSTKPHYPEASLALFELTAIALVQWCCRPVRSTGA